MSRLFLPLLICVLAGGSAASADTTKYVVFRSHWDYDYGGYAWMWDFEGNTYQQAQDHINMYHPMAYKHPQCNMNPSGSNQVRICKVIMDGNIPTPEKAPHQGVMYPSAGAAPYQVNHPQSCLPCPDRPRLFARLRCR